MATFILVDNSSLLNGGQLKCGVSDGTDVPNKSWRINFKGLYEHIKVLNSGVAIDQASIFVAPNVFIPVGAFKPFQRVKISTTANSEIFLYLHRLFETQSLCAGDFVYLVAPKDKFENISDYLESRRVNSRFVFWGEQNESNLSLDGAINQVGYLASSQDDNKIYEERKKVLEGLRALSNPFPNDFRRDTYAGRLIEQFSSWTSEDLDARRQYFAVAGRIMAKRIMGKASFTAIQDMSGRIQLYISRDAVGEDTYAAFKKWDMGDIVGAKGYVFKTKTGELSIHVEELRLLTKSLRPLPSDYYGIADQELKYRQRYVDLIVSEDTRKAFRIRSQVIDGIRRFMAGRDFMEVETPMMHVIPGGAAAKPFNTHHNALDMPLFLRIAPELYLKRLVVGGFERVFEINRNFRNEGVSARHNPEFTMIEFYQAYADYRDLMDLTEDMLRTLALEIFKDKPEAERTKIEYQGEVFDFGARFERLSMVDSILKYNPEITREQLWDRDQAEQIIRTKLKMDVKSIWGIGKLHTIIFEETVETQLRQPTFITEYPAEVSPLARRNDDNEFITDRFEFFIGGREIANGFSELNDPEDQAERFMQQVREKDAGDDEAMHYDADYIRALEYGLPPTAGEGIGIDRLVMLFTNAPSIRDVILFPHMRPEA